MPVGGKPVLRANIVYRGAEVPAGKDRVRFEFRLPPAARRAAAFANVMHRAEE